MYARVTSSVGGGMSSVFIWILCARMRPIIVGFIVLPKLHLFDFLRNFRKLQQVQQIHKTNRINVV